MRIAVLCVGYGWITRGVEIFLHHLMTSLIKLDADYSFTVYAKASSSEEEKNIRLCHVPAISRYSRWAKLYAQVGHHLHFYLRARHDLESLSFTLMVAPYLLAGKYELIFNFAGPWGGWLCQFKRMVDGTPFLHAAQGQQFGQLERIFARQSPDIYVSLSQPNFDWVVGEFPALNVTLIPNGVDVDRFSPEAGKIDIPLTPPVILFVGAMDSMKRPDLIIRAVASLSNVSLLMIGDGVGREEMEQLGQRLLGHDRFLLIPRVPNLDMPHYYNACNLFTLPSPDEPFGIVFLEAMACNKTVVAHHGPVQSWLLANAGLTCDCTDLADYARCLKTALSADLGHRPRKRALEFGWQAVALKYRRVIEETVNARYRIWHAS